MVLGKIIGFGSRCYEAVRYSPLAKPLKWIAHPRLRRLASDVIRAGPLWLAVRRIASLPPTQLPDRSTLVTLRFGWGNEGYSARIEYLEEVMKRAARATGPVLECGSGLTTILLGLIAGSRGMGVWSLEHHPEWQKRVVKTLARYGIEGTEVCLCPLRDYGEFSWYDPPLARMPTEFSLVICDGPPATTPGGRYGFIRVFGDRLSPGAVLLADDAHRPGEEQVLDRWAKEANMKVEVRQTPGGAIAIAYCGGRNG